MKNLFLAVGFFGILFLTSPAYAETPRPNAASGLTQVKFETPQNIIRIMDDGQGSLATTPGPVFTTAVKDAGMVLPELLSTPQPIAYPRWAVTQGWEGEFIIAIEVLSDGTVGRTKVMQSTGHDLLDQAATAAVKSWKFLPARMNGTALVTCVEIPVRFKLRSE